MKKIFIKLYLLILLTLAVGIATVVLLVFPYMSSIEKYDDQRIMKGVIELVVREFQRTPQGGWPQLLDTLNEESPGLVALMGISEVEALGDKELETLRSGRVVSVFEKDTFYQKLEFSDQAVRITPRYDGSFWYTGEDERVTELTVFLVSREMKRQGPVTPEDAFETIRPVFGFPTRLISSLPDFDDPKAAKALAGRGIWVDDEEAVIWCRLPGMEHILVLGPLEEGEHYLLHYAFYGVIGMFLVLIAVCAFLWTRPLWRDLDLLTGVAERFRNGDYAARVQTSRGSAVRSLAEEFNAMAGQIEREISYRIDLADAISHELRTPLARLRFAFGLMEESPEEGEKQRLSEEINFSMEELDGLIEELLVFSRVEHGGVRPEFRRVNLRNWLESCRVHVRNERDEIEVRYRCLLDTPDETAMMEDRLMERALGNLITNAIRYAETLVTVSLERSGDRLSLSVEDDGCGIPEEDREKVFMPFTRLDGSRDRESGNHGLGLAIVHSIAGCHNGQVTIGDSPLGGALICLSWPAQIVPGPHHPTQS